MRKFSYRIGYFRILLPQFRTTINDLIRVHFLGKKSFNSFGDRTYYPNFKKEFDYLNIQ